ncbi:Conserved oligomeric Golgi complex subunit 1 [Psilocybe cubensis]|uniref:Conserved oligomeric Golgi complex subunit 1 n=1 Tax=Psilocybe cubensis TaxID=181762 RepID=A0ACB8HF96_PSICU|nr:Conserved oligomeric Golgi complex subunit 1 [Psilocybe cubensis]KAH9486511.1 Conserved oligomeric Golgi complex subunit 1 [Psilocybe cubensis]
MSTLNSVSSARSIVSAKSNGHNLSEKSQYISSLPPPVYTATFQHTLTSAKPPNDGLNLTPDELFTRQTVSEVRAVQQRLRADAEAKQEELRLMVGERYRDLLQASSSIISIASSSRRVLKAIEECKDAIVSQDTLRTPPKATAIDGIDVDAHLLTLQELSAHMKLLLDAPEHLWRLIERKQYYQAAWLFLLARVVHRTLYLIVDVYQAEFPLVQRQWDVVSQFRSQIIHKSTLSLRDSSQSNSDTCAILVTLHLLDSRPLNDALSALFLQRSKTLKSLLSWNPDSTSSSSSQANGQISSSKTIPVREVTQAMKNSLNTISQTVCTVRVIFQDQPSRPSLIYRVLESIQEKFTNPDDGNESLPEELRLSTQSLLTHLTSSANFQLLPPNLRTYAPYVDLNSSSITISQKGFSQRLKEWFNDSCTQWRQAAKEWFSGLQSVKDVWTVRNSMKRCISGSGLIETEKGCLDSDLESLCHERITEIWTKALLDSEATCQRRLRENPTPVPVLSQTARSFIGAPFQKYQVSLKRQLVGRSLQLDNVISTLEQCARTIQLDFAHLRGGDQMTGPIVEQLKETYRPKATDLSNRVSAFINETAMQAIGSTAPNLAGLAFLGRVTADLTYSSSFIREIGCDHTSAQDFKKSMTTINEIVVQKWREITIGRILELWRPSIQKRPSQISAGPSTHVFKALLSICESVRQLGVFRDPTQQNFVAQDILRSFIRLWLEEGHRPNGEKNAHDIAFLQKLSNLYGDPWADISELLEKELEHCVRNVDELTRGDILKAASEYLARSQTLLSVIIPPPSTPAFETPFLQVGVPSIGQIQQSAIDLAKPSPRFGLLLVGNVER